jgi:hypothetical protein
VDPEEDRPETGELETQNLTSPARQGRVKYSILMVFLSLALVGGGNLLYTHHVNAKSDHQWCEILLIASRPLPDNPPPTADQLHGRILLQKLARDKGCL